MRTKPFLGDMTSGFVVSSRKDVKARRSFRDRSFDGGYAVNRCFFSQFPIFSAIFCLILMRIRHFSNFLPHFADRSLDRGSF